MADNDSDRSWVGRVIDRWRSLSPRRRLLRLGLIFSAAFLLYVSVWLIAVDEPPAELASLIDTLGWVALAVVLLALGVGRPKG